MNDDTLFPPGPVGRRHPPGGPDPFRTSLLSRPAVLRLLGVLGIVAMLWLAVAWAVAVP